MSALLDLDNIFVSILGYGLSYVEFFGTITGLLAVWLASKNQIISWPIGLLSVSSYFFIFYQSGFYSDMGLQVYFFVTGVIGWIYWYRQKGQLKKITALSNSWRLALLIILIAATFSLGKFAGNLHELFPKIFSVPAAFPYWDAFTTTLSIAGNLLLALRILESWVLWIVVDIVAPVLYYLKGINFTSLLYLIFLFIAIAGLIKWINEYRRERLSAG